MDGRLASSEKGKVVLTRVLMYTTGFCPYCLFVKRLFDDLRVPYQEVRVDLDPEQATRNDGDQPAANSSASFCW